MGRGSGSGTRDISKGGAPRASVPHLDSRLRRVIRHGYTVGYATRDGHFLIENGLAGATGGARMPWSIVAQNPEAGAWLAAAGLDGIFRTRRDAVTSLRGSVYAEPHGWAHHAEDAKRDASRRARTQIESP